MSDFKVGDWVRSKDSEINSQNAELLVKQLKSQIQIDKFITPNIDEWELWIPKEGEWCWFYDVGMQTPQLHQFQCFSENEQLNYGERFVEKGQERNSWGYDYCEPFIGELPSFIKDKQ